MTDNVFSLRAVEPPVEGAKLTDQLRILANKIDEAGDAPDTIIVITVGARDEFSFIGTSTIGVDPGPFAQVGILEGVKRALLGG